MIRKAQEEANRRKAEAEAEKEKARQELQRPVRIKRSEKTFTTKEAASRAAYDALKHEEGFHSYRVVKNSDGTWSYVLSEENTKMSELTYKTEEEAIKAATAELRGNKQYKSYRTQQNEDGSWSYILSDQLDPSIKNLEKNKAEKQKVNLKTSAVDPTLVGKVGAFGTMISSLLGGLFVYRKKKK